MNQRIKESKEKPVTSTCLPSKPKKFAIFSPPKKVKTKDKQNKTTLDL